MIRVALKSLLGHKLRLALTALAIVLGVGFVVGTQVFTDTLNGVFSDLFTDAFAGTDVVVQPTREFDPQFSRSSERMPESLLREVRQVEGVRVAEGTVSGFAQIINEEGEAVQSGGAPTLGFSWSEDEVINPLELRSGRPPQAAGEVVVDASTAESQGLEVGDVVTIIFTGAPEEFEVVGVAGFGEADNLGGASLAVFEIETAQRVFGAEEELNTIDVSAREGVTPEELRDRIAEVVPDDVEAVTAESAAADSARQIQQGLSFFGTALLVFAAVALFVGAFIINNTFQIVVAQRMRELAMLRAVGATGRQVTWMVVLESTLVGLIASVLGVGLGILLAIGLRALLAGFGIDLPAGDLVIEPSTVILGLAVGVTVTAVSAALPALMAARIPPVAAMREDVKLTRGGSLARRGMGGVAVAAAGVAVLLFGLFGGPRNAIAYVGAGALLMFLGVAVLSPLVARPLASAIGAPLPPLFGLTGTLARKNAMRSPRRTAATAAALMIGLALVSFVLILGQSIRVSATETIEAAVPADFVIESSTLGGFLGFTPEVGERIRQLDEVGVASSVRFGEWRLDESRQQLVAVDPATIDEVISLEFRAGSFADLEGDGLIVSTGAAESNQWAVGDVVEMEFVETGSHRFRIAGIADSTDVLGPYLISLDAYQEHFTEQLDFNVLIEGASGLPLEEVRAAVESVTEEFPSVKVSDQAEFKESQVQSVNQLLNLVTALLALSVIIAVIGITNTLALSVVERTREIGLLRAVGMGRRQVRRMIRWEAVIIAILGAVLGMAVGVFFGWTVIRALAEQGFDRFVVPGGQLVVLVVLAAVAGILAAVLPARRAARLDVLAAIAYE